MNPDLKNVMETIASYCKKIGGLSAAYEQRENGTLPDDVSAAWDIWHNFLAKAPQPQIQKALSEFAECI